MNTSAEDIGALGIGSAKVRATLRMATLLLPLFILGLHAVQFGTWIVDDAGVSFAYSRNLALGEGLVAQPGVEPVEGYSNPLWVLALSPLIGFGLFHHVWTPKLLSALMALAALLVLQIGIRRRTPFVAFVPVVAASLIAAETGIVGWLMSGLENGLYLLLLTLLLVLCLSADKNTTRVVVGAGLVAAAVSLARPEGLLFLLGYPISVLIQRDAPSARSFRLYSLAAGGPLLAYLAFRVAYFGEWLPNTYFAKGGPQTHWVFDLLLLQPWMLDRLSGVTESIVGWPLVLWAPLLIVFGLVSEPDSIYRRPMRVVAVLLLLAVASFVLLPPDWMPAFRFGTPFYLFFIVLLAMVVSRLVERFGGRYRMPLAVAISWTAVGLFVADGRADTQRFTENLPIPISETVDTARRFERAAALIGQSQPSLLYADIGGPLLFSSLQIVDLGMLCDRTIAEYLGEGSKGRDLGAFHDYILAERKPTFIGTRAYHSWVAHLDADARFRRDYVPIVEYQDEWIMERYGQARFSGDYVRRDRLRDADLSELRRLFRDVLYPGCSECRTR